MVERASVEWIAGTVPLMISIASACGMLKPISASPNSAFLNGLVQFMSLVLSCRGPSPPWTGCGPFKAQAVGAPRTRLADG